MIALFSALEEEIRDFKKEVIISKVSSYRCCRIYQGKCRSQDCLMVLTGMGTEHAKQVAQMITATYPVRVLISTGFGGSLNKQTKVGDIVIYKKLFTDNQALNELKAELGSDSKLLDIASGCHADSFRTLVGNGLTLNSVCSTPEAKNQYGIKYQADIVDMETYSIGLVAQQEKVPFIAARSVFDSLEDDLTLLEHITQNGKLALRDACSYFITHPNKAGKILGLAKSSKKARRNLAVFLVKLVERIPNAA